MAPKPTAGQLDTTLSQLEQAAADRDEERFRSALESMVEGFRLERPAAREWCLSVLSKHMKHAIHEILEHNDAEEEP